MSSKVISSHPEKDIRFARGTANLGKCKNKALKLPDFAAQFAPEAVRRTPETHRSFFKLEKEEQDSLKNTSGWFIGGWSNDGRRKRSSIVERDVLLFDADEISIANFDNFMNGFSAWENFEYTVHTTRKSKDEAPRVRVMLYTTRPVSADEYEALGRILAEQIDPTLDSFDPVSFRHSQLMYMPTLSIDQDYHFRHNAGALVDPDTLLAKFTEERGLWSNFENLPFSEKRFQARRKATKAEDPREKESIVGAFCRVWTVEEAIEEFLADIYVDPTDEGSETRYTFAGGTTSNGAVVYDDGLFLYSWHAHDPAGDRLSNAFDLVRLHLYGHLDADVKDNTPPNAYPSYREMVKRFAQDAKVQKEFAPNYREAFGVLDDEEGGSEPEGDLTGENDEKTETDYLNLMNQKHAMIVVGGKTYFVWFKRDQSFDLGPMEGMHNWYSNLRMPLPQGGTEPISAWWMKQGGRRGYREGITFNPAGCRPGQLNLWTGWAVKPSETASCDRFLEHVFEVICNGNDEHYRYKIGWMADTIQNPGRKPGVASILRGIKGAGKDTVPEYFGKLFPNHHVTVSAMDQLVGKFNAHTERALLLSVQEGFWPGDKKAVGTMNRIITAPTVLIERKGVDAVETGSYLRVLITSNEDRIVPATQGERRYFALEVSPKHAQDDNWFDPIYHERDHGGLQALLHFLLTYDLTGFNVRKPPQTEELVQQKLVNLVGVDAWWQDVLAEGFLPTLSGWTGNENWHVGPIACAPGELFKSYEEWMARHRYQGELLSLDAFGTALKRLVPTRKRVRMRTDKGMERRIELPSLEDCRRLFAGQMGSSIPLWEDDETDPDDYDPIG